MIPTYYILQPDGSQTGPIPQPQVVAYLHSGILRKQSLIRRADLAEFFSVESYPEFSQATAAPVPSPSAAQGPRSAVGRLAPVRPGSPKKPKGFEGRITVWCLVVVWIVLMIWGAKAGWEHWQASSEAKKQEDGLKWRNDNQPDFRVVTVRKRVGELGSLTEGELVIEGEVEEKEAKRHPEYGRAERKEVYVQIYFVSDLVGEVHSVRINPETVLIKNGQGNFTVRKMVPYEDVLKLFPPSRPNEVRVEARIKYEK